MCFAEKSARMRPGCSHWSIADVGVFDWHARLASRWLLAVAKVLPRCGTGARAKNICCDLSSFGPALFEIWWPDIYLGGPYGPVKEKMYWPELVRRSEKCAGPAGQCLCRGLDQVETIATFTSHIDTYFTYPSKKENIIYTGDELPWRHTRELSVDKGAGEKHWSSFMCVAIFFNNPNHL